MSIEEIAAKFEQPGAKVTKADLSDYYQYAAEREPKSYNHKLVLGEDVNLADVFAYYARNNDKRSNDRLIYMTINTYTQNPSEKMLEQVIDLARIQPDAFADIYLESGRSHQGGELYDDVSEKCRKNSLEDNLYMIAATLNRPYTVPSYGKSEQITELPNDKAQIMARIFAAAYSKSNDDSRAWERYHANELLENFQRHGVLINFEPKNSGKYGITAEQIRSYINAGITDDKLEKLNPKFLISDKENKLLKRLLDRHNKYNFHSAKVMNEQNLDPKEVTAYGKARDILLKTAKAQTEKHDAAKKGELKPVSQQFEEFIGKNFAPSYLEVDGRDLKISIYADAYLSAIHEDIRNGDAHKLSEQAFKTLVLSDEDGFWLRKVNEKEPEVAQKIVGQYRNQLSGKARQVVDYVINKDQVTQNSVDPRFVANSKVLSSGEKEAFLEATEQRYEDSLTHGEGAERKQKLEEYKALDAERTRISKEHRNAQKKVEILKHLNAAYSDIFDKAAEAGVKVNQETGLDKESVERLLEKFPNEIGGLQMPKQGSLMVKMFGQKKREALAESIGKFNQLVAQDAQTARDNKIDFSDLSGRMLANDSVSNAEVMVKFHNEQLMKINGDMSVKFGYNGLNVEREQGYINNIARKQKTVAEELKKVRQRKENMTVKAKENVIGHDGEDPLAKRQAEKTTDISRKPRAERKAAVRKSGSRVK